MQSIIITGASRGIGRGAAEYFLEKNWTVFGTSTDGTLPYKDKKLTAVQLDLASRKSVEQAVKTITGVRDRIDVLYNNGGALLDRGFKTFDWKTFEQTLAINVTGTVALTEALLPHMVPGGHILFTGSMSATFSDPVGADVPAYRTSKAAINMYARTLAARLEDELIVASLDPGWVATDMGGAAASRTPEEVAREVYDLVIRDIPTGRFWRRGEERPW